MRRKLSGVARFEETTMEQAMWMDQMPSHQRMFVRVLCQVSVEAGAKCTNEFYEKIERAVLAYDEHKEAMIESYRKLATEAINCSVRPMIIGGGPCAAS